VNAGSPSTPTDRVLEALPCPTLVVDAAGSVVYANAAARRALGASEGAPLDATLGCLPGDGGRCVAGPRCAGCGVRAAVARALAGEPARARGFVLRSGPGGEPADLHLAAHAAPVELDGGRHAAVVLEDVNTVLSDPAILRVCGACGRVEDDEGEWLPLHHFLEDSLGLDASEALCGACGRGAGPAGEP
jgi:hypothetical protein